MLALCFLDGLTSQPVSHTKSVDYRLHIRIAERQKKYKGIGGVQRENKDFSDYLTSSDTYRLSQEYKFIL